jgi:hypothetical protein
LQEALSGGFRTERRRLIGARAESTKRDFMFFRDGLETLILKKTRNAWVEIPSIGQIEKGEVIRFISPFSIWAIRVPSLSP